MKEEAVTVKESNNSWVFIRETEPPKDLKNILCPDETIYGCYKTIRDAAIFTNKRMIIRDVKGVTGTKIETLFLPYTSVKMFSVETAGLLGVDADVIFFTEIGNFKIHLERNIDVEDFCYMFSKASLK